MPDGGCAMSAPEPVSVSVRGELRGERKLPGRRLAPVLRILVAGQHAGAMEWDGRVWHAAHQARVLGKASETEHATAEEVLRAVLRSGFARHLGARAASSVHWSDRARRAVSRGRGPVGGGETAEVWRQAFAGAAGSGPWPAASTRSCSPGGSRDTGAPAAGRARAYRVLPNARARKSRVAANERVSACSW
jgi:hypothetical protein